MQPDTYYHRIIPAIEFRSDIVNKYLPKGLGLEWGPLYWPTIAHPESLVEYADFRTKEESMKHYGDKMPENGISKGMVDPTYTISFMQLHAMFQSKYDFFIANHVFEHYPSPQFFLKTVELVLKPGGGAMISVPDAAKIFDRVRPISDLSRTFLEEDDLVYEHIVLVEGLTKKREIHLRREEIFRNEEDPHLWVFRQDSFVPFVQSVIECYDINLTITHACYNREFEELIMVLKK